METELLRRKYIFAVTFMTILFIAVALCQTPADAKTKTMKIGQTIKIKLNDAKYWNNDFYEYYEDPILINKCLVSHKDVVCAGCDGTREFYVLARGFGKTKITIVRKYKVCGFYKEYLYDSKINNVEDEYEEHSKYDEYKYFPLHHHNSSCYDEEGILVCQRDEGTYLLEDYIIKRHYHNKNCYKTFKKTVKINVKKAKISKNNCDAFLLGNKYSAKSLFIESSEGTKFADEMMKTVKLMGKQKSGKFKKGKGYIVTDKGKKIKFISSGKKTVKYKYKGKTYKIKISTVHSIEKMKSDLIKKIKRNLYFPSSFNLISTKVNKKTNELIMKYSARTLAGYRAVYSAKGSYVGSSIRYYDIFKYYLGY